MKNKKIATSSVILAIALAVILGVFIYSLRQFTGQPRQTDENQPQTNGQNQQADIQHRYPKRR